MEDLIKPKQEEISVYNTLRVIYNKFIKNQRGVSEWFMVRSWKGRVGATPP